MWQIRFPQTSSLLGECSVFCCFACSLAVSQISRAFYVIKRAFKNLILAKANYLAIQDYRGHRDLQNQSDPQNDFGYWFGL